MGGQTVEQGVKQTHNLTSSLLLQAAYIDSDVGKATPLIVFGVTALVAGIIALKLPETKDMSLPETIEDWMNYGK